MVPSWLYFEEGSVTIWLWGCLVLLCLAVFIEIVKRAGVIEVPKIHHPLDGPEQPDHQNGGPEEAGHKPKNDDS